MRNIFIFLFITFTITTFTHAQDKFDKVEIISTKIAEGLYMLEGNGGNMGVSVGDDGVFLIDDQYAPLTEKIIAVIKELSNKEIHFVYNTHYHDDHTGGNENLGKKGIDIIAHEDVYSRLKKSNISKDALPILTFSDKLTLHMNGLHIRTRYYTNAHTDSDSVIYFEDKNVIHMGDIFEQSGFPYVDLDAGGSFIGIINAVDDILTTIDDETVIIPGHGRLSNKDDLINYAKVLKDIYASLLPFAQKGLSVEEVAKLPLLDKYNDTWGKGDIRPETFLKMAYSSILKSIP